MPDFADVPDKQLNQWLYISDFADVPDNSEIIKLMHLMPGISGCVKLM